ncbi:MAG: phenylalanine--tRNA ligase subunit beta [Bacteroidetes bacterium CG23_combo_of_CG06-09_8_20_14_all_32_9]|nr:MAG: phenylalanine--tRNA ligase subunit beta [Bacteroidetes bacterium CG23_combo_of_CG06-09_8_20_14_all_32_9]
MKISYNWLREYINTDYAPVKIAEILTNIGLEVETIEKFEVIKGGLKGLVVGKILECYKHPGANKLSVTKVDIGNGILLNIVCGASNVAVNQKVVVATIGTTLYKNDDKFEIKKIKIRGIESEGMICAEDEIGLSNLHYGIMILSEDAVQGTPLREFFKIKDDYIFEIDLTPNRIDAASHYGVARDLAAYLQHHKPVVLEKPSVEKFVVQNTNLQINVEVENNNACIRYSGVTISNLIVKESPVWLQDRLRSIGVRPVNNVVDITNYVLFETGQPLHAFDADCIKGNKIVVKTLKEGTKFITLDGVERSLSADDLMICNAEEGMCMAGVFGGINSRVTQKTQRIFIESANFNPLFVRKTSRSHGLSTDSSFRFERGADPNITVYALKRAALLITEIAGGNISSEVVDIYPNPVKENTVELNFANVDELIGKHLSKETIKEIIRSLEIHIIAIKEKSLLLEIPTYKIDVLREADVIEEILRIYGYNNIEVSDKVRSNISYSQKPDKEKINNIISDYLASNGFFEIITNSLTKSSYYESNNLWHKKNLVKILNPISADLGVMRQTLLYSGLESISYNINRKLHDLKMFEFGNCYVYYPELKAEKKDNAYSEDIRLALFVTGNKNKESWTSQTSPVSYFYLKSYVENILKRLGCPLLQLVVYKPDSSIFTEGQMYFYNSKELVSFGLLNNNILKEFALKQPVYFAEFLWDNMLPILKNQQTKFYELSPFPKVRRDLALLLDKEITYSKIVEIAKKKEKKFLQNINLFDVYEGDKIPEGKKSYALSFYLQDETKTLTDFQIDQIMQILSDAFEKELGAVIRK